ncbi:MAG: hypothetical protein ACYTFW_01995 [Planctomycetota bacterium]|jgi:N-acyl-D-aspartate/D-glutamate deacylase
MKNEIHSWAIWLLLCLFLCSGLNSAAISDNVDPYNVIIKNAKVFDGSQKPAFPAEVVIKDGTIVEVETSINADASRIIDGKELYICPDFIDLHKPEEAKKWREKMSQT